MVSKPHSKEAVSSNRTLDNALAMFDTVVETTAKKVKSKKTAPAEAKKEDLKKDIDTISQSIETFGKLAENGTYDKLRNTAWEPLLRAIAVELNKELPADLETQLNALKEIDERLKRAESLDEGVKNKPDVQSAITTLRNEAERIMKEWAELLHNQFNQLATHRQLEYETTEESIRKILDSPVFSARVELIDETYTDFKGKISETLVEDWTTDFRSKIRQEAFDAMLEQSGFSNGMKQSLHWKKDDYSSGKLSPKELATYITNKTQSDPSDKARLPKFMKSLDQATNSDEITKASLEILAGEKVQKIIRIIEEELKSDEERHSALGYIQQYFPQISIKLEYSTSRTSGTSTSTTSGLSNSHSADETVSHRQIAIVENLPAYKGSKEEAPSWILKCLKEYNEILIFQNMILPPKDNKSFGDNLTIDQMLRAKTGEKSFGSTDSSTETTVEEDAGNNRMLLETKLPASDFNNWRSIGYLPKHLTLNPELMVKATTTGELVQNGLYDSHLEKGVKSIIAKSSTEAPFDKKTGDLKEYGDNGNIKKSWKEAIEIQKNAGRPTTKEEIEHIIEDNSGIYPIDTAAAGVRMIDALKTTVVEALAHAKALEKEAGKEVSKSKQKVENAETVSEDLRAQLTATLEKNDGIAESLEREAEKGERLVKEKSELEGGLKTELAQKTRELNQIQQEKDAEIEKHKQEIQALATDMEEKLAKIEKIKGFGADKKKSKAIMELLKETQNRFTELT